MANFTIKNLTKIPDVSVPPRIVWVGNNDILDREGLDDYIAVKSVNGEKLFFEQAFGSDDFIPFSDQLLSETSFPMQQSGVHRFRAYRLTPDGVKVYSNELRYFKKLKMLETLNSEVEVSIYCSKGNLTGDHTEGVNDCICRGDTPFSLSSMFEDRIGGTVRTLPVHLNITGRSGDNLTIGSTIRYEDTLYAKYYSNNTGGVYDNVYGCRSMFKDPTMEGVNRTIKDSLVINLNNGQEFVVDFYFNDTSPRSV